MLNFDALVKDTMHEMEGKGKKEAAPRAGAKL
jgi:hypothetical protein